MRYRMAGVLTICLAVGACTNTDPVEAELASVSAAITDHASATASFSGTFTSDARVEISTDGEAWVDLGSPARVNVTLQSAGDESTVHAHATVPASTYDRVRLTLEAGRATVDAGATLGGLSLPHALSLRVGSSDAPIVIERQVQSFSIGADTHAHILFQLNSEAWIHQDSAEEEAVDAREVRESTTATRTMTRTD